MLVFLSVVILCGLIYATLNTKSNEILNEIREFERKMNSVVRGIDRSLDVFQKEIEELKELVGEDK
jgi:vacuolar-type H+-ATPase subunit D/Vma8